IAHAEGIKEGIFSSFLQMRGSIPTFWTQESSISIPKPPIVNRRVDPMYSATQDHFADLLERYGSPVLVLDLVKQTERREREVKVGREYRWAVEHVNSTMPPVELQLPKDQGTIGRGEPPSLRHSRRYTQNVLVGTHDTSEAPILRPVESDGQDGNVLHAVLGAPNAGVDSSNPKRFSGDASGLLPPPWGQGFPVMPMEQQGVLRTNCIDCLDRTNVGQFSIGVHALAKQLYVMGVSNQVSLESGSQARHFCCSWDAATNYKLSPFVALVFMELYSELGDNIALQYGGSEAHKKVSGGNGPGKQVGSTNKHRELLTSIRRYYSNAFTDRAKQDAINLFLGYYVPNNTGKPLWELDTDYYLHNFHAKNAGLQSMREYKKDQYFLDQDEEPAADGSENGAGALSAATTLSGMIDEDRIAEMQLKRRRVRRMCARQRAATSQWWRDALQRYAQRRMWMHLGPPKQGQLPERFVRIHEPERLTTFDKWFSHEFAVPVPAHPGRKVSGGGRQPAGTLSIVEEKVPSRSGFQKAAKETRGGDGVTIGRYVRDISVKARSMLGRPQRGVLSSSRPTEFVHADREPDTRKGPMWGVRDVPYIGSPIAEEDADTELASYAASPSDMSLLVDPAKETDYASYLADFTLATDTAAGALALQRLAEEHHCATTITVEPYEGLRKDVSARRVAAAVVLQMQQLGWAAQRNLDLEEGWKLTEEHLQHSGINVGGVVNQIRRGLEHEVQEEAHLEEILGSEALQSSISTFATEESMNLYWSFSCKDDEMDPAPARPRGKKPSSLDNGSNFVMVEEEMFSSKEYQYMLFNEAGKKSASRILFGAKSD
ncbi:unnamed protein product, partial [Hapterophycus canaliculatus]